MLFIRFHTNMLSKNISRFIYYLLCWMDEKNVINLTKKILSKQMFGTTIFNIDNLK